jgi:hypothetical protein
MWIGLLIGLLGATSLGSLQAEPAATSNQRASAQVVLTAKLSKKVFQGGEPILLSCELRNESVRTVTIWLSGFWPNHLVIVKDETGVEPALSASGKARRGAFAPAGGRDKNVPRELRPREVYQDCSPLDLATLYEPLPPGRYTVEVTYEDRQPPTPSKATSDPASFEVQ